MDKGNKYGKVLTVILIVVIIVIIGVLVYLAITAFKDNKTKETYTKAAEEFEEAVTISSSSSKRRNENLTLNEIDVPSADTSKKYLEDYEIIGTIQIPKIDLKCVILSETTKRALEIAVSVMYSTGGLNKPGTTVIYGHNYRNALFFSRNDELENGDKIYITDREGIKLTYEIYNIFETTSSDTSFYTRNSEMTGGKAEIALSTCTDDASTTDRRLIIQAREVE